MECKVRIKLGALEVDFEGSEQYLKDELPKLVESLTSLKQIPTLDAPYSNSDDNGSTNGLLVEETPGTVLQMTTNNIAAKLNTKTAGDLVLASCAHLSFVRSQDKYSRADILQEMQSATDYFKKSYTNNLSKTLSSLIKNNKLREPSTGTYALEAKNKKGLLEKLNNA